MKVILKEKIKKLGLVGDVVTVKPGYARNFLFPYEKAVQATKENLVFFKKYTLSLQAAEKKLFLEAQKKFSVLSGKEFVIKAKAGDSGKLFGSVGSKDIADLIKLDTGIKIEKRNVVIKDGNIRYLGSYNITLILHTEISTNITLSVEFE